MSVLLQSITKTPLLLRVVALYVIAGTFFWGGSQMVAFQKHSEVVAYQSSVASVAQSKGLATTSAEAISGAPVHITMARLAIDLPVQNGEFNKDTGEWTLKDGAAYYATMSALPNNQTGSTFIYGHNDNTAFEAFKDIAVGDVVTLKTDNNHTLRYTYTHDERVTPDATRVLFETSEHPRLALMTCDGIFSNVRRIMYFDFKDAS